MKLELFFSLALLSIVDLSSGSAVAQIDGDSYFDIDGEAVFIKFSEAGCSKCEDDAPVWDELAKAFAGNENIMIAEIVCDDDNDACQENAIESFPTYKYGDVDSVLEIYEGAMDLESLKKFTSESVRLRCGLEELEHWCNAEELAMIDTYRNMPLDELEAIIDSMNTALEEEYDAAEAKIAAAEDVLTNAENERNASTEGGDTERIDYLESQVLAAQEIVANLETEFDLLLDKGEPLALTLMEDVMDKREEN